MVWYSHVFQVFPQFIVIHTVKGFGIVNKAEIDVFLELFYFFDDPADVGNLISGSSATGGFGIPVELFQILKDAVKVLHSISQQIWKTQQWPKRLEKVSFHSNPKERQCQRMLKLPHNCTHLTR